MFYQKFAELVQRDISHSVPSVSHVPREEPRPGSTVEEEGGAVQAEGGSTWLDPCWHFRNIWICLCLYLYSFYYNLILIIN